MAGSNGQAGLIASEPDAPAKPREPMTCAPAAMNASPLRRDTVRIATAPARIPALDGLRGLMTLFVVFSHYVVEVPHGIGMLSVGWVAVIVFFVLSGFLVGRLIVEKHEAGNFLAVFYIRRMCRTFPTYLLTTAAILTLGGCFGVGRAGPWRRVGRVCRAGPISSSRRTFSWSCATLRG